MNKKTELKNMFKLEKKSNYKKVMERIKPYVKKEKIKNITTKGCWKSK